MIVKGVSAFHATSIFDFNWIYKKSRHRQITIFPGNRKEQNETHHMPPFHFFENINDNENPVVVVMKKEVIFHETCSGGCMSWRICKLKI